MGEREIVMGGLRRGANAGIYSCAVPFSSDNLKSDFQPKSKARVCIRKRWR